MKKEHLEILFKDLRELLRIEVLLSKNKMTQEDAESLQALAEKGYPRAEFLFGFYTLFCLKDSNEAKVWLEKCKKHGSGYLLRKLSKLSHAICN